MKVLVAMSGGVDSSAAAYLLKKSGHECVGITMCLGVPGSGEASCCGKNAIADAESVCRHVGIPHVVEEYTGVMYSEVISPFIEEYRMGRTPNPCVTCNQRLKFGALFDFVLEKGFDSLATGHYVNIAENDGLKYLSSAHDRGKDQSYFLYSIGRERLDRAVFPIGGLSKFEVRRIAAEAGIPVSTKPDSQDVCFYPPGGMAALIEGTDHAGPGHIVDIEGNTLGSHRGIINYTIGQRRGIGIASSSPLYVLAIDSASNRIIVGEKKELLNRMLFAGKVISYIKEKEGRAFGKIRSTHAKAACEFKLDKDLLTVIFDEPQEAITPGQSIVLYDGDVLIMGGIIDSVKPGQS